MDRYQGECGVFTEEEMADARALLHGAGGDGSRRVSIESLVLDSQGFAGWIDRDRRVVRLLEQAERDGADLAMSAATIIQVSHFCVDTARLSWLLSRIRVEAVTKESARRSAGLLKWDDGFVSVPREDQGD